jgi:hypothetical protein
LSAANTVSPDRRVFRHLPQGLMNRPNDNRPLSTQREVVMHTPITDCISPTAVQLVTLEEAYEDMGGCGRLSWRN